MGNRRSPERTEIDAGTQRVLGALGWPHGDPRTVLANMMHRCLTANLLGLGIVLRRHFLPDGRARDLATGEATAPGSEAYRACYGLAIRALIEMVRREHGSLDLLVRGGTMKPVEEVMAILHSGHPGV